MIVAIPVKLMHCPLCSAKIFDTILDARGNTRTVVLPNQCQFTVHFKDGGKTDIGLCIDCFDKITDSQVYGIFEGIKQYFKENNAPHQMEIAIIDYESVWNRENPDGTTELVRADR